MLKFSEQVGQYHVTFVHWLQKPTDNITHTTDHITPVLGQLHWLPVCQRVVFKIAGLVHHLLVGVAPAYLIENDCRLLSDVGHRPLRSNSNDMRRLFMLWTHNNLVIAVSRPPVLDCGMTFHLDYGGSNLPLTPSDNLRKLIYLATEALRDSFECIGAI